MTALRPDLAIIAANVAPGARVLDVGCGDGALMVALREQKGVDARGIEIDAENVAAAVAHGLSVVQGDADTDLAEYPDDAFDYAILSQTLQTTRAPHVVLDELLRIGRRAFVSFPNFAHWRVRLSLLWGGRMPVTRTLADAWFDTPNIHHVTIADFQVESYLRHQGLSFTERFDANSYLFITRAMDYFDLAEEHGGLLANAFRGSRTRFCLIAFDSDWLYPTAEMRLIVHALNAAGAPVSFVELSSPFGHDAFLLDMPEMNRVIDGFLRAGGA